MKPCVLDKEGTWYPTTPCVIFFDNEMKLEPFRQCVRWENLYDSWGEANKQIKHIDRLYTKGFWRKPYVTIQTLEKFKGEINLKQISTLTEEFNKAQFHISRNGNSNIILTDLFFKMADALR